VRTPFVGPVRLLYGGRIDEEEGLSFVVEVHGNRLPLDGSVSTCCAAGASLSVSPRSGTRFAGSLLARVLERCHRNRINKHAIDNAAGPAARKRPANASLQRADFDDPLGSRCQ
jgi:hypothetical protein